MFSCATVTFLTYSIFTQQFFNLCHVGSLAMLFWVVNQVVKSRLLLNKDSLQSWRQNFFNVSTADTFSVLIFLFLWCAALYRAHVLTPEGGLVYSWASDQRDKSLVSQVVFFSHCNVLEQFENKEPTSQTQWKSTKLKTGSQASGIVQVGTKTISDS